MKTRSLATNRIFYSLCSRIELIRAQERGGRAGVLRVDAHGQLRVDVRVHRQVRAVPRGLRHAGADADPSDVREVVQELPHGILRRGPDG